MCESQYSFCGAIDFIDGANLSVEYTYGGNGLREATEHPLERKSLTSDAKKKYLPKKRSITSADRSITSACRSITSAAKSIAFTFSSEKSLISNYSISNLTKNISFS